MRECTPGASFRTCGWDTGSDADPQSGSWVLEWAGSATQASQTTGYLDQPCQSFQLYQKPSTLGGGGMQGNAFGFHQLVVTWLFCSVQRARKLYYELAFLSPHPKDVPSDPHSPKKTCSFCSLQNLIQASKEVFIMVFVIGLRGPK